MHRLLQHLKFLSECISDFVASNIELWFFVKVNPVSLSASSVPISLSLQFYVTQKESICDNMLIPRPCWKRIKKRASEKSFFLLSGFWKRKHYDLLGFNQGVIVYSYSIGSASSF